MKLTAGFKFKVYLLIIIWSTIVIGCANHEDMKWKEIDAKGTEKSADGMGTDYHFNDFIFINNDIGFLAGNYIDMSIARSRKLNMAGINKMQDAIVLRTKDGGMNWEEKVIGKGEIWDIQELDKNLFSLRQSYEGLQANEVTSHIHKSEDEGISWTETGVVKLNLRSILFWTDQKGVGFSEDVPAYNSREAVYLTEDQGKTWKEVYFKIPKRSGSYKISSKGVMYYLTPEENEYAAFDLNANTVSVYALPKEIVNPFALTIDNKDNLYFITENKEERIVLFKQMKDKSFQVILFPENEMLINQVYIYDESIHIFCSDKSSLFPKIKFYHSGDLGKTWNQETLPTDYKANPIAYFGKDNVWAWALGGRLQVRE